AAAAALSSRGCVRRARYLASGNISASSVSASKAPQTFASCASAFEWRWSAASHSSRRRRSSSERPSSMATSHSDASCMILRGSGKCRSLLMARVPSLWRIGAARRALRLRIARLLEVFVAHQEALRDVVLHRALGDAHIVGDLFAAQPVHLRQDERATALERQLVDGAAEQQKLLLRLERRLERRCIERDSRLVERAHSLRKLVLGPDDVID